jgi:hypothetical protein
MTHSQKHTTEIYLEKGREALTDRDFIPVEAGMLLKEVLS